MKKIVFVSLCLVVFGAFVRAQKPAVDVVRQIADATPAALPQLPKVKEIRSDLFHQNLKGKVKAVATYNIDHERRQTEKYIVSEEFYNEDGDRVRGVYYNDNSQPRNVAVYGFIDNMRVARWGDVKDDKGQLPSDRSVQIPVSDKEEPARKSDTRFDTRYVFKYDSAGRLAEEVHLSNTGELLTRSVYKYETPTRRLIREFAGGTEELARMTEILDDAGNVIERWLYDEDKKVQDVQVMKRGFDPQGNWTVEKVFVKETVNGKTNLKPLATNYRTITYYE
jgi:hypothetical protein